MTRTGAAFVIGCIAGAVVASVVALLTPSACPRPDFHRSEEMPVVIQRTPPYAGPV